MYVTTYVKNIIFLFIIFYLRLVNSYTTKKDVLKIKNEYNIRYYCKDDICNKVTSPNDENFMEFPDKSGNLTKYIVYTCTYDIIEKNVCFNNTYINDTEYSLKCNNDSECLSNKCFKNHCMFNDETPIVHCGDIYSNKLFFGSSSYMYCGKPPHDTCKKDDECSSKKCGNDNICQHQNEGSSDSDGIKAIIELFIFIGILIVIIIIVTIICCRYSYKKNHKLNK